MLARTFQTHKQLGIKKKEYDALIRTMLMLERGEAVLLKNPQIAFDAENEAPQINPKGFSMAFAASSLEKNRSHKGCGTVACIGGWTAYHMGAKTVEEMEEYVCGQHILEPLFYPDTESEFRCGSLGSGYDSITPSQAAQAIGNYLTTGKPNWDDVLGVK